MGWNSGAELADELWKALEDHVELDPATARFIAEKWVKAFQDHDCDVMEECEGVLGDVANRMNVGAPKHADEGDVFVDPWKTVWRFDGRRWREVE